MSRPKTPEDDQRKYLSCVRVSKNRLKKLKLTSRELTVLLKRLLDEHEIRSEQDPTSQKG